MVPNNAELAAKPPQRPATPPLAAVPVPVPVPTQSQKARGMKKDAIDFPEADPWGSPDMHRGHSHISSPPRTNGAVKDPNPILRSPVRTTSNFTTTSAGSNGSSNPRTEAVSSAPTSGGWGAYDGNATTPFRQPVDNAISGQGFGGPGGGDEDRPTREAPNRAFGGGRISVGGVEENIVVSLLPEKEGVFMFQHHNYHVASARRGSKVVRRYSDFVWLLDCLQKRFPFRQLPLLPPKRVGGEYFWTIIAIARL
jgi:sorting nexin-8